MARETSTASSQSLKIVLITIIDKQPQNLGMWISLIGNLVRSLEHGRPLELFLDHYLKRETDEASMKPAFLDGPAAAVQQH